MTTGGHATGLKRADVILVPFPFAELTASKARPALILTYENRDTSQHGSARHGIENPNRS